MLRTKMEQPTPPGHADPVVPDDFHKRAGAAAKHEQIAAVRIAPEMLLHHQRQPVHPLAHSVCPIAIHTRAPGGIIAAP